MNYDFALSRGDLDSSADCRGELVVSELLEQEGGRLVFARYPGRFVIEEISGGCGLWSRKVEPGTLTQALGGNVEIPESALWFMGRDPAGVPQVVVSVTELERLGRSPADSEVRDWQTLTDFAPRLVNQMDSLIATQATALLAWHEATGFCHRCGNPLQVASSGWTRSCTSCAHVEYPRTDPAIIVAVLDPEDRLLLVHNTAWPTERMSLLAGYVDAGESTERTVLREVKEEVGLTVGGLEYLGSQPWPKPRSLMFTYKAHVSVPKPSAESEKLSQSCEPIPDEIEIDRARFFSREELAQAVDRGEVSLPGPAAVAHTVIQTWLDGNL